MSRRILIVGAGFAGSVVARSLERTLPEDDEIVLVDPSNRMTYVPLLPEVVGGALLPGHIAAPIRPRLKRTKLGMATVEAIEIDPPRVHCTGPGLVDGHCDHLVLAPGRGAALGAFPGMAAHALPIKRLGDALRLRNRVVRCLEEAAASADGERRRTLLTFVVIGGGYSGVETASQLLDLLRDAVRIYPGIDASALRVLIVHRGRRLLPELDEGLAADAARFLEGRGLEIHYERSATRLAPDRLVLADGEEIASGTIVTTVGSAPHPFVRDSGLPLSGGRIRTDATLRVEGCERVWAAGDCALVPNAETGKPSPPTAQDAEAQGRRLAGNLAAALTDEPPRRFGYRSPGQIATIGHCRAVGRLWGVPVRGRIGWLLWRAVFLWKIPTLSARVRIFLEWNWAMFFRRDLGYLDFTPSGGDRSEDDAC